MPRVATSPSVRSISSPGGWAAWNGGSRLQDVERQVDAQPVGRGQADVLGDVDLGDLGDLERERHAEDEHGDPGQRVERRAGDGAVDEPAQDLGLGERQPGRGEQQQREQRDPGPLRPEVGREQAPVADRRGAELEIGGSMRAWSRAG